MESVAACKERLRLLEGVPLKDRDVDTCKARLREIEIKAALPDIASEIDGMESAKVLDRMYEWFFTTRSANSSLSYLSLAFHLLKK